MVAGVAINRSDELVRGEVKRAERLVCHVDRQELDIRRLFAVGAAVEIFAAPDWPDQSAPLIVCQSPELVNYFCQPALVLGARLHESICLPASHVDEYLAVIPL